MKVGQMVYYYPAFGSKPVRGRITEIKYNGTSPCWVTIARKAGTISDYSVKFSSGYPAMVNYWG